MAYIKLVLEKIHFFFDNKYFLHTRETAMGTKVAPDFATLVLRFLEEKLFSEYKTIFEEEFSMYPGKAILTTALYC